ncbi:hypothetical protein GMES_1049 [Paraglaciecola mesophila KMM 241]|uniref:Glycosyltransferase 2-like domain-containing protein n=1 Tax=Paraglaciecola mesophila KMM 241 TaxID=1128912 RepID=K6Z2Z2_9ALTE|nr:glycosyltransferase family A protein [Paraglaciecola mesophila]GAC23348.1 hypothetical protein GMES_1049 [Paraglaciecola mesophila KMM 241]
MNSLRPSVVIITHERPDYLKSALQSVLAQTVQPFEIIIVNDCSETDYQPVMAEFSEYDIDYVRLNSKSGANTARNVGVAKATGDVVCFLDDDDVWLENFLEVHESVYRGDSEVEAIICGHRIMGSASKVNINSATRVTAQALRYGNRFSGMSGFSAKRSILLKNLFDTELKNGQDWDLFVRLVQANTQFINLPRVLFLYRKGTPNGITEEVKKMSASNVNARLRSAHKHRKWLGEKLYKRRMAEQILSYLPNKSKKFTWIQKSIELAGVKATIQTLASKVFHRLQQYF